MNRNIEKYIRNAERQAHERVLNFDGSQFPAEGQVDTGNAAQSQPYIVQIANAGAGVVSNVDVFGAFQYANHAGFNAAGNLVIGDITISSGIGNVSYRELLQQSQMNPFTVGLTYIYSLAGGAGQVFQPFTVNTRDANGNQASKAIIPLLDPMQNQNGVTIVKQVFRIDGATKLTFANVLAGATFQLQLFPANNIVLSRGLAGETVSRQFAAPAITKQLG